MDTVTDRLRALDSMTSKGKILESLSEFFHEDCTFTEMNDGAQRPSLSAQQAHLGAFFSTLKGFNGATLHAQAVTGDTSMSEWTFDMVAGDGSRIVWKEVIARTWKDGLVTEERYYNATA